MEQTLISEINPASTVDRGSSSDLRVNIPEEEIPNLGTNSKPEGEVYSQAFGFSSFMEKGVDPRTGQYTSKIKLYEVPSEARNCPELSLSLQFNPLNNKDIGFGIGWAIDGLSKYLHREQKTLSLSTGEQYKVLDNPSTFRVEDRKLESFVFERLPSTGLADRPYRVVQKSGIVEILSNQNDRFNAAVPVRIYGNNGRSLTLTWAKRELDETARLSKITDDINAQDLLRITYSDALAKVTIAPETSEEKVITFVTFNDRLTEIRLPLPTGPSWKFSYEKYNDLSFITSVTSPTGLTEDIVYNEKGHMLPQRGPYDYIPNVASHTAYPNNGQPPMLSTYTYSSFNFLGYGSGSDWNNGEDNLYNTTDDYQYWSTVETGSGVRKQTVTNKYNKYHLLFSFQKQKGSKIMTQEITYYALLNKPFKDQPAWYGLPKEVKTTHWDKTTDKRRVEKRTQAFDNWGNILTEFQPDGSRVERVYFSNSVSDGPVDPYGFQKYLKTETFFPADSEYKSPERKTECSYTILSTAPGAPSSKFVVPNEIKMFSNEKHIATGTCGYIEDEGSRDLGRVSTRVTALAGSGAKVETYTFSYSGSNGLVSEWKTVSQLQTFDELAAAEESVYSALTGLTLSEKDTSANETKYEYNAMGELLSATTSPDTKYEAKKEIEYSYPTKSSKLYQVTMTDPLGAKIRQTIDGLERIIQTELLDVDGSSSSSANSIATANSQNSDAYVAHGDSDIPVDVTASDQAADAVFRTIQTNSYDDEGRLVETIDTDWLRGEKDTQPTAQKIVREFEYDDWGQVFKTTTNKSSVELTEADPISRSSTVGFKDAGYTKTWLDENDNPVIVERYLADNTLESKKTFVYDGSSRLVLSKNALSQTTRYAYDEWDRVVLTTLPDDSQIATSYIKHSHTELKTDVEVRISNGDTITSGRLGHRIYDGAGRVSNMNVGGRATKYEYSTGWSTVASKVITPENITMTTETVPELGNLVTEARADAIKQSFSYHPKTGDLLRADEDSGSSSRRFEYFSSGKLKSETIKFPDGKETKTRYEYSLGGKLQTYRDVFGRTQSREYDGNGRISGITDEPFTVNLKYDNKNQPTLISTTFENGNSKSRMETELVYDDFGRQVARTLLSNDSVVWKLTQSYTLTDQTSERKLTNAGGTTLRNEKYRYDNLGRLSKYLCDGEKRHLPQDERGRTIKQQDFKYDFLNNISLVTFRFDDGSEDTASYIYENSDDPTQLSRVEYTNPKRQSDISYNALGQEIKTTSRAFLDGTLEPSAEFVDQTFSYDVSGRLTGATDSSSESSYRYNGSQFQAQSQDDRNCRLHYREGILVGESAESTAGTSNHRYLMLEGHCLAYEKIDGNDTKYMLVGTDVQASVFTIFNATNPSDKTDRVYTPFGAQPPGTENQDGFRLGFNGERVDPFTNDYLLGGYRAYNPRLGRFRAPDSLSPFGTGGTNPYTYVGNDPVNNIDPTGHEIPWRGITTALVGFVVGIVMGILTAGLAWWISVPLTILAGGLIEVLMGVGFAALEGEAYSWKQFGLDFIAGGLAAVTTEFAPRAVRRVGNSRVGKKFVNWKRRVFPRRILEPEDIRLNSLSRQPSGFAEPNSGQIQRFFRSPNPSGSRNTNLPKNPKANKSSRSENRGSSSARNPRAAYDRVGDTASIDLPSTSAQTPSNPGSRQVKFSETERATQARGSSSIVDSAQTTAGNSETDRLISIHGSSSEMAQNAAAARARAWFSTSYV